MAINPYNNKIELSDGTTIMDITDTTASEADVVAGKVFYKATGQRSTGTADYMEKVSNPTANDILITDANGQAVDSGVLITDKQDKLVSGTNIKTVGGQSVLGSGDIAAGNADLTIASLAVQGTFKNGIQGEEIILSNATDTSQILIRANTTQGARFTQNLLPTKTYVDNKLAEKPDAWVEADTNLLQFGVTVRDEEISFNYAEGTNDCLWVTATQNNRVWNGYFPNKTYVDGLTGDLSALTTTDKTSLVSAINEVYEKSGEPFRVKNWAGTFDIQIPTCTTDISNTQIPKMTFSISGEEGVNYQIVGMIAYEVFDSASGGNRLNVWPVCQFTGNGQKELSVRWMCGGTTAKNAKRINAWVLLKHR